MKSFLPVLGLALLLARAPLAGQLLKLSPEEAARAKAAGERRLAYAASKDYNPYDGQVADLRKRASALLQKSEYIDALDAAERGLARDRFNLQLLLVKAAALRAMGDTAKADEIRQQWTSLMDSILTSGDGRSFATAFRVITVDEEYSVLQVMRIASAKQSLVEHDGSSFDVLTVKDPGSGKESDLYFNIDLPRNWLNASFATSGRKPATPPAPAQDTPAAHALPKDAPVAPGAAAEKN